MLANVLLSEYLTNQIYNLEQWMTKKALPLWSTVGINPDNASVYERLNELGQPDSSANLRTRVQARQIFVFASAQSMGWMENALPCVAGIDGFLNQHAKQSKDEAGFAHLLSHDGKIIDAKKDAYDFAFYILACAYRYKVFHDLNALDQANKLVSHIESDFKDASGGWLEGNYDSKYRRQNPHMHLFEAFLTCYEFTRDGKWLAKAGQIYTLFETIFFDHKTHVIREYFDADWTLATGHHGRIVEPGHMYEWIWLLRWYQKLSEVPVDQYCDAIYRKAMEIGCDKSTFLVFDEVTADGTIINGSKRLWPITELIKSSLAQAIAHPEQATEYENNAAKGIDTLFRFYLNSDVTGSFLIAGLSHDQDTTERVVDNYSGRFVDQLGADNSVVAAHSPASTLYHIAMATIVAVNYRKGV
ncbi:MAG: mannose-6-phosphate isomerase [Paraglaciecola sp.]|jgi:mannose-6-phosphate isomerase